MRGLYIGEKASYEITEFSPDCKLIILTKNKGGLNND
jgi:hypothetical protein